MLERIPGNLIVGAADRIRCTGNLTEQLTYLKRVMANLSVWTGNLNCCAGCLNCCAGFVN